LEITFLGTAIKPILSLPGNIASTDAIKAQALTNNLNKTERQMFEATERLQI
jgi:hypothetical protein